MPEREDVLERVIAALRPIAFSWWQQSEEGQHLGPSVISDNELRGDASDLLAAALGDQDPPAAP